MNKLSVTTAKPISMLNHIYPDTPTLLQKHTISISTRWREKKSEIYSYFPHQSEHRPEKLEMLQKSGRQTNKSMPAK